MNFRKWILALTVLALCVAGANAQVNTGNGGNFSCTTINASVTPSLRAEGITDLVGDIVLSCTGGTALALGAQIPQANITVFLNTQVTSRLLGNGLTSGASEAVLLIDEPNSGLPGFGPQVPFTVCPTPGSGCVEFVGNSTTPSNSVAPAPPNNIGVPVGANPNNLGTALAFNPAPIASGANAFQGVVNGDGKSVTFFGVPIMPPVSSGASRVFRITNIRANASAVPTAPGATGSVQALISISGSSFVPLTNSQLTVGYVVAGLNTSLRNTGNTGGGGGTQFNQCNNTTNNGLGTGIAILRYQSNFGTAFKTRVLAGSNGNSGQNGTAAIQDVPGSVNNSVSESGFIFNGAPLNNITTPGIGPSQVLGGNGQTAGLADFGTRFKATFNNIPTGVSIFVSSQNLLPGTNAAFGPAPAPTSTTVGYAQLVVSDTSPENGVAAPVLSPTGSNGGGNFVALTPASGTNSVTAVWEVINSNTSTNQNFDFGVYLSYTANVAQNLPLAPSTATVSMSFAPISNVVTASSSAPIPRFVDLGGGANRNLFSINICTTSLLFPYVTTVTGFDTGIAISNTTLDPFGTTPQSGACTLYWYGNNNGGTTNTPIPNGTSATTAAPVILAGTTWTTQASATAMAGQNFTGYMIATCNFQLAHGYAAITDIGSRGILSAYLALVINGRGQAGETFSH